jgi:hypothetical protein
MLRNEYHGKRSAGLHALFLRYHKEFSTNSGAHLKSQWLRNAASATLVVRLVGVCSGLEHQTDPTRRRTYSISGACAANTIWEGSIYCVRLLADR